VGTLYLDCSIEVVVLHLSIFETSISQHRGCKYNPIFTIHNIKTERNESILLQILFITC
jgi:hypothetical protein